MSCVQSHTASSLRQQAKFWALAGGRASQLFGHWLQGPWVFCKQGVFAQHSVLLPQVPQSCVRNLSQEQLHTHKDEGTASPSHIFQVLGEACSELSNRTGSSGYVTGKELGWG